MIATAGLWEAGKWASRASLDHLVGRVLVATPRPKGAGEKAWIPGNLSSCARDALRVLVSHECVALIVSVGGRGRPSAEGLLRSFVHSLSIDQTGCWGSGIIMKGRASARTLHKRPLTPTCPRARLAQSWARLLGQATECFARQAALPCSGSGCHGCCLQASRQPNPIWSAECLADYRIACLNNLAQQCTCLALGCVGMFACSCNVCAHARPFAQASCQD